MDSNTRRRLLATTAITVSITWAQAQNPPPGTTPQGGAVVSGSVAIRQAPGATTITQSSQRAAIDWQSFNVGAKASVTFRQPGPGAIVLNRVVSPDASRIEGRITANGQVVLINQSGVVFTRTARVDAQSLVVSTSGISNRHFMAGDMRFDQPPHPGARIVNRGHVTVKQAGLAAFVAPQVANRGVITARLGHVVLAGADAFTLDLYGDRLISLDVTRAVRQVDLAGRHVTALVTNSGVIVADGGTITLTANQADALVQNVLDVGGTLRADTVGQSKGSITIAGVGGDIQIAGNLLARGTAGAGGAIGVSTDGGVTVRRTALIDASGAAGGGTIAIGAAPHRAASVAVARGARIVADATGRGNGGTITLRSHGRTDQAGALSAQGHGGGDGGLIETSSDGVISLTGTETVLSIGGHPGEILLDPATLVVGTGTASGTTSYIDPATLDELGGVVVLEASNLIAVASPVTNASADIVALNSQGAVTIGAAMSLTGALEINATTGISIGAPVSAVSVNLSDSPQGFDQGGGFAAAVATSGALETTGGAINTGLLSGSFASGSVILDNPGNAVDRLTGFTVVNGDLTLADGAALTVSGGVAASNIALTDRAGIAVAGLLQAASGGTIALASDQFTAGEGGQIQAPSGMIALAPYTSGVSFDPSAIMPALGTASVLSLGALPGHEAGALSVSQPVGNFPTLTLTAAGVISNTAPLAADTIGMNGGGIALNAPVTAVSALTLASGNGVSQTAPITTALLSGTVAAGDAVLNDAANRIAATANFTVANGAFSLDDAAPLNIAASLTAARVSLADSGGGITEAGGIAAGTLSGLVDSGSAALTGANTIATISSFAVPGGDFILNDAAPLTVAGALSANNLSLNTDGLTIGSRMTAGMIALGSAGGIIEAAGGVLAAPSLAALGTVTGNVDLGGNNVVGTLGGFAATGDFAFTDTAPLTVAGGLAANNIALLDPVSLTIAAGVTAAAGGAVNLVADQLNTGGGAILAPGGTVAIAPFAGNPVDLGGAGNQPGALALPSATLAAIQGESVLVIGSAGGFQGGALTVTAPVSLAVPQLVLDGAGIGVASALGASGTLALASSAGITEPGGVITAPLLTGAVTGDAALGGANAIGALGAFTATGSLDLADTGGLTIDGPVDAQNAAFTANGINFAGNLATGALTLASGNGISQSQGVITAASLASIGTVAGPVSLGDANAIGTLANFSGNAAFSLNDATALVLAGAVDAADLAVAANGISIAGIVTVPGVVALGGANVTEPGGAIAAGTLASQGTISGAVSLIGANSVAALGDFASTGALDLTDDIRLAVAGTVTAPNIALAAQGIGIDGALLTPGNLALSSRDGVTEAGRIAAVSLNSAGIDHDAALTGANRIASLGVFPVNGGALTLRDDIPLTIAGPVNAPDATFIAPALDLAGMTDVPGVTTLDAAAISQTGGLIETGTLDGATSGAVTFGRANQIGTLGGFTVQDGVFTLNDAGPLTVTGPVAARAVSLSSVGQMVLQGAPGGGLYIGGSYALGAPAGPRQGVDSLLQVSGPNPQDGGPLYFTQTGDFEINGGGIPAYANHQSSLFIALAASGRASFADLIAPSTELFLDLGGGTGKGKLDLARLVVVGGEPGQVNFTGTLDNVGGEAAAHNGQVVPIPESNFLFNGCVIGSVSCIVIPIEAVPEGSPLRNFVIGHKRRRHLPRDVRLPGITSRDY